LAYLTFSRVPNFLGILASFRAEISLAVGEGPPIAAAAITEMLPFGPRICLAPAALPAGGIIPTGVIQGLLQGFEANAGYAETDMRDTHVHGMPRAPRLPGMRSGLP